MANKPMDFRIVERNGKYYARLLDKATRAVITEKSVRVLAQKVDMDFDGVVGGKGKRRKAEEVCQAFIEFAYNNRPSEPRVIEYCTAYWDFDGERVTLANKKSPNSVARSSCYINTNNFKNHMRPYFERLGNPRISEVTSQMLNDIQDDIIMNTGLSNSMIEKVMRSVSTPINDAWKHGNLDRPVRVDRINTQGKEKGILTQSQIADIVRQLYVLSQNGFHRGANEGIALASLTAMRMGEIRALCIDQFEVVNDKDTIIHITRAWNDHDHEKSPKGKRTRQVVVPTVVARSCIQLAQENPHGNGRVFWVKGNPDAVRSSSFFRENLYQAMELCGITEDIRREKNITFHSLRHGFVTYIRHQVSDGTMRLAVGHRDKETTDRYTHLNMDNLKELADSTERTFKSIIDAETEIANQ